MNPCSFLRGLLPDISHGNLFRGLRLVCLVTAAATLVSGEKAAALSLSAELVGGGPSVRIVVQGEPGKSVRLESSTTLASWQSPSVLENPTRTFVFNNQDVPAVAARFCRAIELLLEFAFSTLRGNPWHGIRQVQDALACEMDRLPYTIKPGPNLRTNLQQHDVISWIGVLADLDHDVVQKPHSCRQWHPRNVGRFETAMAPANGQAPSWDEKIPRGDGAPQIRPHFESL